MGSLGALGNEAEKASEVFGGGRPVGGKLLSRASAKLRKSFKILGNLFGKFSNVFVEIFFGVAENAFLLCLPAVGVGNVGQEGMQLFY